MVQWGNGSIAHRSTATVTFPIAFGTAYQMVTASTGYTTTSRNYGVDITVEGLTNTTATLWNVSEDGSHGARGYRWIAVGKA